MSDLQSIIENNPTMSGLAQVIESSTSLDSLDDILDQIKDAPAGDLLSVNGVITTDQQIIKYDDITLHEASTLELTNLDVPWIAIATKTLRINAPQVRNIIRRSFIDHDSLSGENQPPAANGIGYSNEHPSSSSGRHGGHGTSGAPGKPGLNQAVPDIIFICGEVVADFGTPARVDTVFGFDGVDGGNGGSGGDGGDGGAGERGTHTKTGVCWCRQGPGYGGNGGNGGSGGAGGSGANGSQGSDIILVGPESAQERLAYFAYKIEGGEGGNGGEPGRPGRPAPGGMAGKATGCCRNADRAGKHGDSPTPPHFGRGSVGSAGNRGSITVVFRTISDLF